MSISPFTEDTPCPYCRTGLIGKIVTCDLRNPQNYFEELIIITTYICVGCQTIIEQEVRDFTL